ncbi:MAG: hypothetical protein QM703_04080 [Gemmatales bacterium]
MSTTTFHTIVENGQIRMPPDAVLKEKQTVYLVVPDEQAQPVRRLPSVRLVNPEDAQKFEMKVLWDTRK